MAECTFKNGNPVHIDYTPSGGNIAEGEVVVVGTVTGNTAGVGVFAGIASRPITNNTKGALALGGVWEVTNLNNAANGALVYWSDSTVNKVTTVSTNNAQFGIVVGNGGGGANSACLVLHQPVPSWDDA